METLAINETGRETDLVSRIRAGEQQAEAELVEQYSRGIRVFICRKVGHTAVADDLYQETFWIVLKKIRQGDVREPEKLSSFIGGVARNLVIDYFRHAARQESLTETEEDLLLSYPAPDQFQKLLQKEKAALVRQVLEEMPNERDRLVLFRFYLAEEEKEQICADLGLTSLHFNLVLHRARERYKELYERAMRGK